MRVDVTINDSLRLANGLATVAVTSDGAGMAEVLDLELEVLNDAFGPLDPVLCDFLLIAGAVYVIDKTVPRRHFSSDGWTRELEVHLPVSSPERWQAAKASLHEALDFLTGDTWALHFGPGTASVFESGKARGQTRRDVDTVSLFSGGLDSLVGALDLLATSLGRMALVGHHDATTPAGDQTRVYKELDALERYAGRTDLHRIRLRRLPPSLAREGQHVQRIGTESTQRSRSLVFLALGMAAAHALGPEVPLVVPENGFIAVNLPLTPSRIGTCSTRTTHPHFLRRVGAALVAAGVPNQIRTPLVLKTKGEIVRQAADQAAVAMLAPLTASCSHSSRKTYWRRKEAKNCGYCYPCLIRRGALFAAGLDSGTDYGLDICAGELPSEVDTRADYRAVLDCLATLRTPEDVRTAIIANGGLLDTEREQLAAMVWRGLEELRTFVRGAGSAEMCAVAAVV